MKLRVIWSLALWWGLLPLGCATTTGIAADGTQVYEVTVKTLDGLLIAGEGPTSAPTLTITSGAKIIRAWLAPPKNSGLAAPPPPRFTTSAKELEDGIVIETSWETLILYNVSQSEMRLGTASIDVPSNPTTVVLQLLIKPATREIP